MKNKIFIKSFDSFVKESLNSYSDYKHVRSFESFSENNDGNVCDKNINLIMDAYLETALWTDEENAKEQEDLDIDDRYDLEKDDDYEKGDGSLKDLIPRTDINIHNIDPDSKIDAYLDIKKFLKLVGTAVEDIDETSIGHDLWLSRNGHGAGFFDHMYDPEIEEVLMDAAKSLGSKYIFIQNGQIFFE